jgi:hypothetical protein
MILEDDVMWHRGICFAAAFVSSWLFAQHSQAQVRLIGITGNQTQGTWNGIPQESLFEIDVTDGRSTFVVSLDFGFDSQAIGYNLDDGNLYRTAGRNTYRCSTPSHYSFNDTHYMEKMNAADIAAGMPIDTVAIFNADPQGRPNPAPRPDWVFPAEIRVNALDPCYDPEGEDTNDEYNALRGLAYSAAQDVFYGTDLADGLFKLTPDGDSMYWSSSPRDGTFPAKGMAILNQNGTERLFVSGLRHTAFLNGKETSEILELDPFTAQEIRAIPLQSWHKNSDGSRDLVDGVVALAFHPITHELYGISVGSEDAADPRQRELVKIDLDTGILTLIGDVSDPGVGINLADIAFVPEPNTFVLATLSLIGMAGVMRQRR